MVASTVERERTELVSKAKSKVIREAAARIFLEKGYRGTTIQDIADEAGILKGNVHYYISSKQALFFEVMMEVAKEIMAKFEALDLQHERPDILLRSIFTISFEDAPRGFYVFSQDLSPDQQEERRQTERAFRRIVTGVLCRGIEEGLFAPVDVSVATFCISSVSLDWGRFYKEGGRLTRQQIADRCADLFLSGLKLGSPTVPQPGNGQDESRCVAPGACLSDEPQAISTGRNGA